MKNKKRYANSKFDKHVNKHLNVGQLDEPHGSRILSALLILGAIVMIWRGVWGLMDIYLVPEDPTMSYIISIVAGLFVLALTGKKIIDLILGGNH